MTGCLHGSFLILSFRMVITWAAWATKHEFNIPNPVIDTSDEGGFVNSLPSEMVVICSNLEMRSSSVPLRTIFSVCRGVMIMLSIKAHLCVS